MELLLFVNETPLYICSTYKIETIIKNDIENYIDIIIDNDKFEELKKYVSVSSTSGDLDFDIQLRDTDLVDGDMLFYKLEYPVHEILYSLDHLEEVRKNPYSLIKLNQTFILAKAAIDSSINHGWFYLIEQTPELCSLALSKDRNFFLQIKDRFKTREICEEYFNEKYQKTLEYIQNIKNLNLEGFFRGLFSFAVFVRKEFGHIPRKYSFMNLKLVSLFDILVEQLPDEKKTKDFYISFMCYLQKIYYIFQITQSNVSDFIDSFVPKEFIEDVCIALVRKNSRIIQDLSKRYKTRDVCFEAVYANGELLQFVPDDAKEYEICMMSVNQNPSNRFLIPKKCMTQELQQAIDKLL